MDILFQTLPPMMFALACAIAVMAGVVKGLVGFAMPMVLISGLSTFIAPDVALAGLILPTVVTNVIQALRQGPRAALVSLRRFWLFLTAMFLALIGSAQLVPMLDMQTMFLMIGVPVVGFALLQISGKAFHGLRQSRVLDAGIGGFAGFIGGVSGVWGAPTVAYLTGLQTEKHEQMRAQGVIYGVGAVALFGAHLKSGVLRPETAPLSIALVPAAVLGMWIGGRLLDGIDQKMFRKATLLVLLIAGMNLVRRGLVG